MSYYEDLTPYNYHHHSVKELNVGWLEKEHEFNTGDVPDGFIDRLKTISENQVFQTRGFQLCHFCKEQIVDSKIKCATSSCEIRVIGKDGIVYASPQMIVHYIEEHKYLPPQQFIDAVMEGPLPGTSDYDEVFKRLPESWQARQPDSNEENFEDKLRTLMVDTMSQEIDKKIIKDILEQNEDFQKFIESYNKIMPSVYNVGINGKIKNNKSE